ncbi:acetyltransferase (GNAT) family protein [Kribbella rubisoli]|uniref:Acetyltransferase (GNAT) family protein n=1 Tax=Kribbella rubisoli TaxID=3075929 RepID=A0A4Q7WSK3_9ACTN|nr:GNAT family N-acetyltransferase [Kribbella rubisoli]RZU13392.1 acetyltransferase (GNAT) family protein [Kribbella rubisoli]
METNIEFREWSDERLPEVLKAQALSFLRIIWPEGFTGPNRFRDWTSHPDLRPHHLLYAAGSQLVSHLEIITTTVSVGSESYVVQSPTAVMTFPAFRGEGWARRLVAAAVARIDAGQADVGVLTCGPHLADFYSRAGWEIAPGATILAGEDGSAQISDDILLTRSAGPRSAAFKASLREHPMRVADEW